MANKTKATKYIDLKGNDRTCRGDEYMPFWEHEFKPLPPSYGWRVKEAPASKFRRPVRPAKIQEALATLM